MQHVHVHVQHNLLRCAALPAVAPPSSAQPSSQCHPALKPPCWPCNPAPAILPLPPPACRRSGAGGAQERATLEVFRAGAPATTEDKPHYATVTGGWVCGWVGGALLYYTLAPVCPASQTGRQLASQGNPCH